MAKRRQPPEAAEASDSLAQYRAKRDFARTPEPQAGAASEGGNSFVVQKHAARRLHFDFRLELDGVLKSWAVTKGPSVDPADRRLAVHVEDHPLDYGGFEGVIPAGEYGGGTVMLWDVGTWEPVGDPHDALNKGHLKFHLHGQRMTGGWTLVRMAGHEPRDKGKDNWLLIKERDEAARPGEGTALVDQFLESVTTGRPMDQIARDRDRVHKSNRDADGAEGQAAAPPMPEVPGARPARLPDFVQPELAVLADAAPAGDSWLHEIKFDGYRTIARIAAGEVRMLTRRGLDWTKRFGRVPEALARLPVATAMLDGEIVVFDETSGTTSFGALQNALDGGGSALTYMLFDLLHLDGQDLTAAPLEARKAALKALLDRAGPIAGLAFSDHFEGRGPDVLRKACGMALEGIISKPRKSAYQPGRGHGWVKTKCINRQEFVIGGFIKPTTGLPGVGSLLMGYYEGDRLVYAGKVGTGFTEAASRALRSRLDKLTAKTSPFGQLSADARRKAVWVEPKLVAEVEFAAWTDDGMLRHAAFKGLREDKDPASVVREEGMGKGSAEAGPAAPAATADASSAPAIAGVTLSHPDRVLYPDLGLTKRGLADYYVAVADLILPHLVNRPISLVRCPQGQKGECFFQRHAGVGLAEAIRRVPVREKEGKEDYLAIDDLTGLMNLVQMNVLELHPWGALADDPDRPDRIILDFDPDEDLPFERVKAAAVEARDRLQALKLRSFVKVTGGKGLHVVVPIVRKFGWPEVKGFARALAAAMQKDQPDRYEITMAKKVRKGKIFIDYLRNDRTATAIAPYSTRARPGAPVAAPVDWDDLPALPGANIFTVDNMPRRLTRGFVDPWAEMPRLRQSLTRTALTKLGVKVD